MHHADINAALQKAQCRPSQVAVRLKVSRQAVSGVIRGNYKSKRIAGYISRVIGIPVSSLWPGRYAAPAKRKRAA